MALASTRHPVMSHIHPKFMGYTAIIIIQIFIMALGYLMRNYPGEVTMLVTSIATVLSIATTIWDAEALNGRVDHSTPVYFMWPVQLNGSEIDITGSAFATLLREEFLANGLTFSMYLYSSYQVDNAFEILDIGGMLSGVAAAGFTFGAKYNISTLNTGVVPGSYSRAPIPQGFSTNYSMWQQGLTANVSCQAIDSSQMQYLWNTNSDVIYTNPAASSNNPITGLRLWNIRANCGTNTSTVYEYVTLVDANGSGNLPGNGFLPSVVCPGLTDMNQTYTSFISVCEVVPLLTTVRADYSNEQISSEVISSTSFQSENAELLSFIAGVARYQSIDSQGLTSSTIGDTLYSIYSSTTTKSVNNNLNDTQIYLELISFMTYCLDPLLMILGRFLRSGFMAIGSFPDNIIPNNLSSPVNGTMFISTIGWTRWTRKSPTYLLATIPLTIITILTFACAFYSILQYHQEHQDKQHYRANFDVSNILHLIIACAGEKLVLSNISDKIKRNGGDVHPRDLKSTDLRKQEVHVRDVKPVHVENNHV
ncbi:uncharacterized protein F5891DRAFT_987109 [Suillus fuscotomentosus]|uniref:Uncharacterized protein n=1 Tax=Suillus fuscotomentosus TaxID=1912939 RepID=A0AAD4DQS8_9AGAM|nr:uncharacterized protein F5891DRAFT_987109 [Suillus fuscotomentosus]KAG1890457.1 hypothetical protein F5891DRAFT_987109 [Suillus fuscotomentosus]